MKTTDLELFKAKFEEYILTVDEMINVRGGESDPIVKPTQPPTKI
jgi:hypothetical protein